MRPYQQSPNQIGPAPQREISRRAFIRALAVFGFIAASMAFIGGSDSVSCAAPQQVASK